MIMPLMWRFDEVITAVQMRARHAGGQGPVGLGELDHEQDLASVKGRPHLGFRTYAPPDAVGHRHTRSPLSSAAPGKGGGITSVWQILASSVLTLRGERAMTTFRSMRPAWRLSTGTARSWMLAGHAASGRRSAGRTPQPQTVTLSCSSTRRSWSATRGASGSARRRSGRGTAAGRSALIRRTSIRRALRAFGSCGWPDCQAGDIPTAARGRRAEAASSRKPTRTPRWSAVQSWAMTPNGPATSASHRAFGSFSGEPSAPPIATS